jgi:hypothetical protein
MLIQLTKVQCPDCLRFWGITGYGKNRQSKYGEMVSVWCPYCNTELLYDVITKLLSWN